MSVPAPTPPAAPKYRTILADPPWDIQQKGKRGAGEHYQLMTLERITAMPVADLAADDAHLWLWVTNATLRHGYDVAEAWGFTVRSPLTWIKFRLGLGNYLRNSTEHLLFATKGTAPVRFRSQPTWIQAPVQDHSHKPEEQYALIERISPGPYLELFARRQPPHTSGRDRWHVWGNQIHSDIHIPGYPVPNNNGSSEPITKTTKGGTP
ncbi:MT-A70 family methyltransferase [Rudaeicoccus suwonensis]|uniref:N6-adenosine-specific RNA methylase IME4 n=1 Tax=Rudaeicoccus suwonensis TaxID=657409 RepID=A0A561EAD4_9MICO|nr:MT-A70 family methyltransferase [Rudaeicoccus suwonensis]TWE12571.1 N6-adenosine-specific RNA methylase IME4 [Rudaeicoccus suwonensis]